MRLLEKAIAFVAPHDCLVCQDEGSLLCAWCAPDACPALPDRCYLCLKLSPACRVCKTCRRKSQLRHVWVATAYGGAAKDLIAKLKFGRAKDAAEIIADFLDARLPHLEPNTIITHIPASTSRARVRGYDQAQLIAKSLAGKRGLSHIKLLARYGQKRQLGASRQRRLAQLNGAFRPSNLDFIGKTPILLIDDVLTTGATLESAAKTLRQAGARVINATVFAQTSPGRI